MTVRYTFTPDMTQHPHSVLPYAILYDMIACMMYMMRNVIKISLSLLDLYATN